MDELLSENAPLIWRNDCIDSFETLKRKLTEAHILRFLDWKRKLHAHTYVYAIIVSAVLTQLGYDHMDHPNTYAN